MGGALEVSDALSNTSEQIEHAAKTIGRSVVRRKVFEAIYHHKAKVKSVDEIALATKLRRVRVLQEGKRLVSNHIVRQTKKHGLTAYEKIDFFHAHKKKILGYAQNPKKLASLATKRKVAVALPKQVSISSVGAKVKRITIDDVHSFAKVKRIKVSGTLPSSMSEAQFKRGMQAIIGEPGRFKDWGGEKSDLYTTRLRVGGKRIGAAFAFKGPGQKGKLVPGRMGKNGDQMPRLFQEDAEVFWVQHWREIDASVIDLMRSLAVAKSVTTGQRVLYGTIDGWDSERLRTAYSTKFVAKRASRKRGR